MSDVQTDMRSQLAGRKISAALGAASGSNQTAPDMAAFTNDIIMLNQRLAAQVERMNEIADAMFGAESLSDEECAVVGPTPGFVGQIAHGLRTLGGNLNCLEAAISRLNRLT